MTEELSIQHNRSGGHVGRTAVITEGVGDVTSFVRPVSDGDSPSVRVGVSTLDILGDLVTLEPPERDLSLVPEHSEDTTASLIEQRTSASLEIVDGTTGVAFVRTLTPETEWVSEEALWLRTVLVPVPCTSVRVQLAFPAGAGVQGVLVERCLVHVLDDVNLMERIGRGVSTVVHTTTRNKGIFSPLRYLANWDCRVGASDQCTHQK